MRAIVTGQVGVDKGPYLDAVRAIARQNGIDLYVCHVGQMMYAEAPEVPVGRILNLPINRLNTLRRSVFKEIQRIAEKHDHVLVNTHATFRWKNGLFEAFDYDQMKEFDANVYATLMDNVENVHARLMKDHDVEHTLKDIMVWREEELLATEILAKIAKGHGHFFTLSRGRDNRTADTLYKLMFRSELKKVYLSFPMTHVMDQPAVQNEIQSFKQTIGQHFIAFDPADVDEWLLHTSGLQAMSEGKDRFDFQAEAGPVNIRVAEMAEITRDIMGQTYARDFKMIDQSDMIISLVPEMPTGKPALSSGVERELQHAFESGKEVYVIWTCKTPASPFITQTATRLFTSPAAALDYFKTKGYIPATADKSPIPSQPSWTPPPRPNTLF